MSPRRGPQPEIELGPWKLPSKPSPELDLGLSKEEVIMAIKDQPAPTAERPTTEEGKLAEAHAQEVVSDYAGDISQLGGADLKVAYLAGLREGKRLLASEHKATVGRYRTEVDKLEAERDAAQKGVLRLETAQAFLCEEIKGLEKKLSEAQEEVERLKKAVDRLERKDFEAAHMRTEHARERTEKVAALEAELASLREENAKVRELSQKRGMEVTRLRELVTVAEGALFTYANSGRDWGVAVEDVLKRLTEERLRSGKDGGRKMGSGLWVCIKDVTSWESDDCEVVEWKKGTVVLEELLPAPAFGPGPLDREHWSPLVLVTALGSAVAKIGEW